MFRQITSLVLVLGTIIAVNAAPARKITRKRPQIKTQIDFSSRTKIAEAFFTAASRSDKDAMWQILSPEVRKLIIKDSGSEAKGKQEYWAGINATLPEDRRKSIARILAGPETKKQLLSNYLEQNGHMIVFLDGKWYVDPTRRAPDLSSKEKVMEGFWQAFIDEDPNAAWQFAAPGNKTTLSREGTEGAMIRYLKDEIEKNRENSAMIREGFKDPQKKTLFIRQIVQQFDAQQGFIQVGGKWYIDFIKLGMTKK